MLGPSGELVEIVVIEGEDMSELELLETSKANPLYKCKFFCIVGHKATLFCR